jgi:hypothetical protein
LGHVFIPENIAGWKKLVGCEAFAFGNRDDDSICLSKVGGTTGSGD